VVRVLGIDGCRAGWVAVVLSDDGVDGAVARRTVAEIVAEVGPVDAVGIDIPIGLPSTTPRAADVAAQRFLGGRRSTVFSTPIREALEAATLAEAIAVARLRTGRGISAQAYALRSRILEVDAWLPGAGVDVREVHPEVSFAVMSGTPLPASKRTWNGMQQRVAALAAVGIELPRELGRAGAAAGTDDVLDAAAVAWSARRVAQGVAVSFPSPPAEAAIWA
jgi:predicted RNase H-like nuclease